MTDRPDSIRSSFAKTTVVFLFLAVVGLLTVLAGSFALPSVFGRIITVIGVVVALGAFLIASAGAIVLIRYGRHLQGKQDLFLELNASREPEAIKSAPAPRTSRARRWLARRLLGHDFVVGDFVEVKTWSEIKATLDEDGCLEQLPFMPEMLAMCGNPARVFRCMHRLFDYRKSRRMRHMHGSVLLVGAMCDGSAHGGCNAACHTIWKTDWLRRVEHPDDVSSGSPNAAAEFPVDDARQGSGTQPPRYTCQLTQLNVASEPIGNWSAANFIRPLVAGNVAFRAFVVGRLTYLFNKIQHLRQGVSFPAFGPFAQDSSSHQEGPLKPGDQVIARSPAEIRATLNDQLMHRGMGFESDMLKYCGQRCRVGSEVKSLIDIVTGEMRTMKTPAYILKDIHFSGERQLFNAQYEPLFWRSAWLNRVEDSDVG